MNAIPMYSEQAKRTAEKLGLKMGRPNLEVFSETLQEMAQTDSNILVTTSDSRGSGKLKPFGEALPAQIVEVGIAEQNLVGIAAGLASTGKKTFAVSPACFLSARSFEQVKNDIAYSNNPVILIGISAGVSYGALGTTHHSLHDFAAFRAVNNLTVEAPADNVEARMAIQSTITTDYPRYIRFGKAPLYTLPNSENYTPDKATTIRSGEDGVFIATGETVIHALLAAQHLHDSKGLNIQVLSLPTIDPLDSDGVKNAIGNLNAVVTVEEHMTKGGLGDACASLLLRSGLAPRFETVGIPDEYTVTGSQAEIFNHYGISMEGLAATMQRLLGV